MDALFIPDIRLYNIVINFYFPAVMKYVNLLLENWKNFITSMTIKETREKKNTFGNCRSWKIFSKTQKLFVSSTNSRKVKMRI